MKEAILGLMQAGPSTYIMGAQSVFRINRAVQVVQKKGGGRPRNGHPLWTPQKAEKAPPPPPPQKKITYVSEFL